jgi:hypothetical protein
VLNDYRRQLVSERVRLINRLRWHLVQIAPEIEAQIRPAGLIGARIRAKVTRQLARLPHSPQLRVAKAILKRVCENYREESELLAELTALVKTHCPALLAEHGCGPATAAIIIGHTAGANASQPKRASPATRAPPDPGQFRQHQTPPATRRRGPAAAGTARAIRALSTSVVSCSERPALPAKQGRGERPAVLENAGAISRGG